MISGPYRDITKINQDIENLRSKSKKQQKKNEGDGNQ
jgi:hypothetical protein